MVHEFRPSGFGEAVLAFVLRWTLKLLLKPVFSTRCSIGFQRRWLAGLSKIAIGTRGVGVTAGTVGGVPGEWSRRTGAPARPGSILYLHGGAYCVGSPATHRALTSRLARVTGLPVFAADYRLAPEHPFPAALDDAEAVTRWAADSPALLGFEVTGLITCGDSAGGNLALVVGQQLALRPATAPLLAQWALYPLVSGDWDWPSMRELGEGYMATEAALRWFMQQYGAPADDPRYACLSGEIPADVPLLVHTAELDPLRDQGRAYAAKAQAAGTPTWQLESSGQIHGFATMRKTLPSAQGDVDAFIEAAKATLEVSGV